MREMILAQSPEERLAALDKLFVFQKQDMLGGWVDGWGRGY
jgi:hypothetical protein